MGFLGDFVSPFAEVDALSTTFFTSNALDCPPG